MYRQLHTIQLELPKLIETANPTPSGQTLTVTTVTRYGINVPNWLREENERVVLFGALQEAFTYLQEEDQAAKYLQLFFQEIEELNACLLYTSPSPRDRQKSRMPSSA